MTLVVITVFTAHQKCAVHSRRHCILNPDHIHRTEAANRDKSHELAEFVPMHTRHVNGGIGVVFTGKDNNAKFILIIIRHLNSLNHGADHINIIIGEADNSFRTGAHTGTASTAAGRIRQRRPLLIIIKSAERTFLSTPLTLCTALEKEIRIGFIAGTWMNSHTAVSRFNTLNRL